MDWLQRRRGLVFIVCTLSLVRFGLCQEFADENEPSITVFTHELTLKLHDKGQFNFAVVNWNKTNATLDFIVQQLGTVKIAPSSIILEPGNKLYQVNVVATGLGHSGVHVNSSDPDTKANNIDFIVTVYRDVFKNTLSSIVGWLHFIIWSLSFYPQVFINYQRKSVVGLNFDFLALNVVGFALYSIFNLGLYLIPSVEAEYLYRYPRGLNPVKITDVFQAVHSTFITTVTIIQCYVYEAGSQRVSGAAKAILALFAIFLCTSLILSSVDSMNWLDFLYICSYIKLVITLIKYAPQAYMNYKRKSTVGWSIGTVLLDFTGGVLSIVQMILDAYNYDDWASIFGDATKMGLGIVSSSYDVIFMTQHYCLYNHKRQMYEL